MSRSCGSELQPQVKQDCHHETISLTTSCIITSNYPTQLSIAAQRRAHRIFCPATLRVNRTRRSSRQPFSLSLPPKRSQWVSTTSTIASPYQKTPRMNGHGLFTRKLVQFCSLDEVLTERILAYSCCNIFPLLEKERHVSHFRCTRSIALSEGKKGRCRHERKDKTHKLSVPNEIVCFSASSSFRGITLQRFFAKKNIRCSNIINVHHIQGNFLSCRPQTPFPLPRMPAISAGIWIPRFLTEPSPMSYTVRGQTMAVLTPLARPPVTAALSTSWCEG